MRALAILFLEFLWIGYARRLKVLMVVTPPSPSQIRFSAALAEKLTGSNHQVDLVFQQAHPAVSPALVAHLNLHKVMHVPFPEHVPNRFVNSMQFVRSHEDLKTTEYDQNYLNTEQVLCSATLNNSEYMTHMLNQRYDVGVAVSYNLCASGLFHLLKVNSTHIYTPHPNQDGVPAIFGIPAQPNTNYFDYKTVAPNLFQRAYNTYKKFMLSSLITDCANAFDDIFRTVQPDMPPIHTLYDKHTFFFANTDEFLDLRRPLTFKSRYIGGIALKDTQNITLPNDYDKLLSIKPKGAVLFSMGSLVKTSQIPMHYQEAYAKTFAKFPDYLFIWKYDEIAEKSHLFKDIDNIKFVEWAPQQQLIADSRLTLFITHMGMNSYLETSFSGKPTLGLPVFVDQNYNALAAELNHVSKQIDKFHVNEETLTKTLSELLNDKKYAENARRLARMLRSKINSASERFVDLIERAARLPRLSEISNLHGRRLNFIQYYNVDCILPLSLLIITLAL